MLFNSLTFVVFFVVVVTAYWSIRGWERAEKSSRHRELHFLRRVESAICRACFFHDGDGFLARPANRQSAKIDIRGSTAGSSPAFAMNLSMLGFFKYGNFLLENFKWLMAQIGIIYQPPHLDILLPVGISFYTFHSLSYTLDIYRGVLQPTKSLRDFVLAVSFFPQLVAGPIVRAGDFLAATGSCLRGLRRRSVHVGIVADDARPVRKNRPRRHDACRFGRSHLWLRRTTCRA